jgi:tetratricopeptide (TPR) repeat protein
VRKNLGWFCSLLGDHTSARAHLERGAEVFKAHGRLLEQAGCLFYLGETAYRQHQLEGAARRYREGLELTHSSATDAPTTLLRADLLNALGRTAYQRDELLAAQAHCEDALAILRGSGDRYALAVCLSDLGLVSLACGLPNRAEGYLEESLAIMRDLQVPLGIARALNNLANLCYEEAAYRRAEAYLIEALAIFEDLGDAYGTALADYNLGRVYYHEGAYEAALRHHQKSLLRWQVLGNEVRAGGLYNHLGRVCLALERFDEAQSYFLKSLSHAHHDHERAKVANALAGLGLLFERRGEEERAHLCLACALHLYRSAEAVPQAPKAFFDELLRLYPAERLGQAQDTDAPPNLEHLTRDLLQGWATQ